MTLRRAATSDQVPAHRGPSRDVSAERLALEEREGVRCQPRRGSDRADVVGGDGVAGTDVLDDEQGPTEPQALPLALTGPDAGPAEGLPGDLRLGDEGGELVRLEGEVAVDAPLLARHR